MSDLTKKFHKVLLIAPPNTISKTSVRRLSTPIGLLYVAAALENAGYVVHILDSTMEGYFTTSMNGDLLTYGLSPEETKKKIIEINPDIVGVSSMFTARQKNAEAICRLVKEACPQVPIVLGGIHPSLFSRDCLSSEFVDYVVIGEGEERLPRLLADLNAGKDEFDFDGVGFKKNGRIIINPLAVRIKDLDSIAPPARHLVDLEKYIRIGVPFAPFSRRERVEQILTSRGCPNGCNFCATVNYWGRYFRMRSVDNVMAEVDFLVKNYGIEELQFVDDNITVDRARAMEIFTRLVPYNLSWCTPNGLSARTLDPEMLKLMAKSGAYQITIAIESGSDRVLKQIVHKLVPPKERIIELVKAAQEAGIDVHGMFIVGFPGETKEEMMTTLDYPFDVGFDSASFFIANPIPGSELYAECQRKGYLVENSQVDFKSAEINIPTDSSDFVMPKEEMIKLVDDYTHKLNELSKNKNPEKWNRKFEQFLKRHGDQADLILGRVT